MKLQTLFSLLVAFTSMFHSVESSTAAEAKKNVILFVADDLGFQIGAYGDKVAKTPAMDRLASMGTKFTRAFCTTASCSASRSVIMTGLYNHATGHYGHAHGYNHFSTYDSVRPLSRILADAGYRTCSIGKYHLAPRSTYYFETYANKNIKGGSRNPVKMAMNAEEWIREDDDRPFFLYFCTSDPHRGGGPGNFANFNDRENPYPETKRNKFDPADMQPPPWLPQTDDVKGEWAEYYQAINRVDQGLEKLLEVLKETDHLDDTMILVTSDNGPPFPGAKTCLYQPGANLPLIVYNPDVEHRGVTTNATVCWADYTPTILDYCDVEPPKSPAIRPRENGESVSKNAKAVPYKFHGKSFLPALGQKTPEGFDEVYLSHTFHEITMYYPMRVIISGDYKLTFNIAHQLPYPFASDLYASPTWQGVLKRGDKMFGQRTVYSYLQRPRFELYNITKDPWESTNLANLPEHQKKLEELQAKLQTWQKQTRDPWELKWRYE